MSKADIIEAYEAGLITREEAVEQGLVDNLDALYRTSARPGGWMPRETRAASRGQVGR